MNFVSKGSSKLTSRILSSCPLKNAISLVDLGAKRTCGHFDGFFSNKEDLLRYRVKETHREKNHTCQKFKIDTVDGRNPVPPGMYKTL